MIWINEKLQKMREEEGFTLIELMVVVLIIAILIAIAIPTFLGARTRAQDRAAQSSARNALTNAKALYTDNEDYQVATNAAVAAAEPSLDVKAHNVASAGGNEVSVEGGNNNVDDALTKSDEFFAAVKSSSGTCWYIRDYVGPTAANNQGTRWYKDTVTPVCDADTAEGIVDANWTGKTPGTAPDLG